MALVAYLRVSTGRQQASGLGLEAQREAVERYASSTGQAIGATFVEVESGAGAARPRLQEALALCRKGPHVLLIARLDRLSRSLAFIAQLLEAGVDVRAADVPEANRLTLQLLAVFAEHERRLIRARTKAALAAAKARGVVLGRHGVVLAARHREAAAAYAKTMKDDVLIAQRAGASSLTAIAASLNKRGIKSREGALWHPASVARLVGRLGIPRRGLNEDP